MLKRQKNAMYSGYKNYIPSLEISDNNYFRRNFVCSMFANLRGNSEFMLKKYGQIFFAKTTHFYIFIMGSPYRIFLPESSVG